MCYVSHKKTPGKLVYVSGIHYNSDMFKSYWYVCTSCDASIEVVSKGIHFQDPTCNCSSSSVVWCQTSVVESDINLTKEEQMETTETTANIVPESYNSNLLVTYKVIRGYSDAEYATDKITTLEWDLHNGRQSQKTVGVLNGKIDTVKDIITEAYEDSEDKDTLRAIAEALSIELVREVQFTATLEVSGTYTYNILDSDYELDLDSEVTDALYADSNNGNIQIDDTEVCHVREA